MDERFPVLVTGTTKYVVWVDAEDETEAHEAIQGCESDWVEDVQAIEGWLDAKKDPAETAHFIWLYGSQFMPQHDAHVHTHRWATRAGAR